MPNLASGLTLASPLVSLIEPLANEISKVLQVVYLLQVDIHLIPVDTQILMRKYVPKASQRRKRLGERGRKHAQLTLSQNGFVVVSRFGCSFQRNDPIADIDTALRCDLEIALNDVSEIGIAIKLDACFFTKWSQARQAFVQFVQAPLDTAELGFHGTCHR